MNAPSREKPRWFSGAAVALVAGGAGAMMHTALRAESVAAPGLPVLVLVLGMLSLLLWPLAARTTGVGTLTAILLAAQFGGNAAALASAGRAGGDLGSWICCPAADQVRPGPLGSLAAHGGWGLVVAQALSCLLVSLLVRGGRAGADTLIHVVGLLRDVFDTVARPFARPLVLFIPTTSGRPRTGGITGPPPGRAAGGMLARRSRRRGPPARPHRVCPPGTLPLRPCAVSPVAG
jgi:hypothetical protein